MWLLLFCATLIGKDHPVKGVKDTEKPYGPHYSAEDCEIVGLFNTSVEAVEFGHDYCMDDFHCMARLRLNPVEDRDVRSGRNEENARNEENERKQRTP